MRSRAFLVVLVALTGQLEAAPLGSPKTPHLSRNSKLGLGIGLAFAGTGLAIAAVAKSNKENRNNNGQGSDYNSTLQNLFDKISQLKDGTAHFTKPSMVARGREWRQLRMPGSGGCQIDG